MKNIGRQEVTEMADYEVAAMMQRHDLHKLHGLGNDFLIWIRDSVPEDSASIAQLWCDRRRGIGADGLILAIEQRRDARFVLFNSDGSRAEVSGNGLRCVGHVLARRRGYDELSLPVETDAGSRQLEVSAALSQVASVAVSMGSAAPGPSIDERSLSGLLDYESLTTIDLGNPHLVIEVKDIAEIDMATIGSQVEGSIFPEGINVEVVAPTAEGFDMLVWERGVGVTESCGSGACAAASALHEKRPSMARFVASMPGGDATVHVGEEIVLVGPSSYVCAVEPVVGI